jgi:dihydroflavonol-4-reductase
MILVLGGTGLVGSHLLVELTKRGENIRALKRQGSDMQQVKKVFSYYGSDTEKLFDKIEWAEGDLLDHASLYEAMEGVGELYHAAAIVSFRHSDKKDMIRANVEGTANVVNAALENGVKKMCYVSSVATLSEKDEDHFVTEANNWKSLKFKSAYAESKYKAELEVWRGTAEGLTAVIVNPSVILGAGNWNKSSSAIFSAIYKGLKFYTDGATGYVDVRDVVSCMIQLMKSKISNERFLLNAENRSFKEMFSEIAISLGKKAPAIRATPALTETAWIFEAIKSKITGKESRITKETVRAGQRVSRYSNQKVTDTLNYSFIPLSDTVKYIAGLFLKDHS